MRLFGLLRRWAKSAIGPVSTPNTWTNLGGWLPVIRESVSGAWQRNIELQSENVLTYSAVYGCVSLIASDMGKLRLKLVFQDTDGIWNETDSPAFSPVLRKPNHYQTRIKFIERWMTSKLIHGNTYVLKQRDNRGVVVALYVLDPTRCRPMVSPDGSVFYAIGQDNLAGVDDAQAMVPASEIIHDVMNAFYHDLCGVSPLSACGLAAVQGLNVQRNSAKFFANGSTPGGILSFPGTITDTTAKELRDNWETNFSGDNFGRVAVLGDGLTYAPIGVVNAVDSQLIEQLKWSAENVCTAFHVPAYMIGVGPPPAYNNIEALATQYYAQCLQTHIESIEALLDEGLGLDKARTPDGRPYGTEFDLDDLLRMDTTSRVKAVLDAIGSGGVSPNEARKRWLDLGPVPGGDSPYLQQQQFSLQALSERDRDKPFSKTTPAASAPAATPIADGSDSDEQRFAALLRKELALVRAA